MSNEHYDHLFVCDICKTPLSYDEWKNFGMCAACDGGECDHDDTWDYEDEYDEIDYDPYSGMSDPYVDWYEDDHSF